jgi:hypothetical protein
MDIFHYNLDKVISLYFWESGLLGFLTASLSMPHGVNKKLSRYEWWPFLQYYSTNKRHVSSTYLCDFCNKTFPRLVISEKFSLLFVL